jgi:hypothetical protein
VIECVQDGVFWYACERFDFFSDVQSKKWQAAYHSSFLHFHDCDTSQSHLEPTMVTAQSFRLPGKPYTKDIACYQVDGENIVLWRTSSRSFLASDTLQMATPSSV